MVQDHIIVSPFEGYIGEVLSGLKVLVKLWVRTFSLTGYNLHFTCEDSTVLAEIMS